MHMVSGQIRERECIKKLWSKRQIISGQMRKRECIKKLLTENADGLKTNARTRSTSVWKIISLSQIISKPMREREARMYQ